MSQFGKIFCYLFILKLKFHYKFFLFIIRKRAANNQSVSSLKPYVKCYLRPDSTKATKKKYKHYSMEQIQSLLK